MTLKWTGITMAAVFLVSPVLRADSDVKAQLSRDQQAIEEAQKDYRKAVMEHGASSDEAKKGMDRIDSAKNKLAIDQKREQELNQIDQPQNNTAPQTNNTHVNVK